MAKLRKGESLQAYDRTSKAFAFILLLVHIFFFLCSSCAITTSTPSMVAMWCNNAKKIPLCSMVGDWHAQCGSSKLNHNWMDYHWHSAGSSEWRHDHYPCRVCVCVRCKRTTTTMIEKWKIDFFPVVEMCCGARDCHWRTFHFCSILVLQGSNSNVSQKLINFGYDSADFNYKDKFHDFSFLCRWCSWEHVTRAPA